jgi:hypothetical protein
MGADGAARTFLLLLLDGNELPFFVSEKILAIKQHQNPEVEKAKQATVIIPNKSLLILLLL